MSALRYALPLALLMLSAHSGIAQTDSLPARAEKYFATLMARFEKTAQGKFARGTDRAALDRHLVWVMGQFPTMHSFVKTNSKGKVINRVSFGKVPKRVVADIPDDTWYSFLKRNQGARESIWFDRESGRYYLVWSRPVELGADKTFAGVLAVKIDLWDTFHKFAKTTGEPWLAFVNGKALYSRDWKRTKEYSSGQFAIPGVKTATIRYAGRGGEAEVAEVGLADSSEQADVVAIEEEERPRGKGAGAFLIVLLLMVAVGSGVTAYLWYRRKQADMLKAIDRMPPSEGPGAG